MRKLYVVLAVLATLLAVACALPKTMGQLASRTARR